MAARRRVSDNSAAPAAFAAIVMTTAFGDWIAGFAGFKDEGCAAYPYSALLHDEMRLPQAVYGDARLVAGVQRSGRGETACENDIAFRKRRTLGG